MVQNIEKKGKHKLMQTWKKNEFVFTENDNPVFCDFPYDP